MAGLTFDGVGGEESEIPRLDRVVVGELCRSALRLRFTGQRRVINLASRCITRLASTAPSLTCRHLLH